jgi:hypothetical protein
MEKRLLARYSGPARLAALVAALTGAVALVGCGGDQEKKGSARLVPPGTKLSRLDMTVSEPRPGIFRYRAPKTVQGGLVEMRLRNAGKSAHKAQLWRVGAGHSVKEAVHVGIPRPRWLIFVGGVPLTRPRGTGKAVQRLLPGIYYVTGAGGERGTRATFRVTGRASAARLPAPASGITAVDYSYRFKDLQAGDTALEFANTGKEPHHAYFAPMQAGRTLREVLNFVQGKLPGPPPVDQERVRETPILEGGQRQVTRLDLQSGRYAVLCFVSDREGGPPHIRKGMALEVKVP